MSGLKLYTYPENYRANKALIAAQYAGVDIEVPAFEFGKDNKSAAFLALNPLGKVPVLETPNGGIFESNAIARYVARLRADVGLLGDSFYQQGQVDQWIDFVANEIEPSRAIWVYPILGYLQFNAKANAEAKKELTNALTTLNTHLLTHTYLVGNHVTLADIIAVSALVDLYKLVLTPKFLQPFANVTRWFTTCINQPEFSRVLGTVTFAKEEAQPAKGGKAAAEPKKEAKKEEPKKEEPKEEKKEDLSHLLDDEDKPKPKKANPLDALPATSMVLDPIKKLAFSQRPFLADFFEQLWPQFDAAGWSFHFCTYNYNDENKVFYMTGNALGGFLQRSDACRKYAMGVMNISGNPDEETPPFTITGCWLFRGQEMIAEMKEENPDSEYYTWKKLDVTKDEDKKLIKEQFMGEQINGVQCLDRRYFK